MTFFSLLIMLLRVAVEYLSLKKISYQEDYVEKKDAKINDLNERREKLRARPDQKSQDDASKLMDAILDEKKKLAWFLKKGDLSLTAEEKQAKIDP